jgi:hypothetical protein
LPVPPCVVVVVAEVAIVTPSERLFDIYTGRNRLIKVYCFK